MMCQRYAKLDSVLIWSVNVNQNRTRSSQESVDKLFSINKQKKQQREITQLRLS